MTDESWPCYWDPRRVERTDERLDADLCVYGGSSAGITAAVQAARLGLSVVLLHPGWRIGGMTTNGLGWTDAGVRQGVGGLARQFYREVGSYYNMHERWFFEPHVAMDIYTKWLHEEEAIAVRPGQFLESAELDRGRLTGVRMTSGLTVRARQFIDATYEGDLMAAAGVAYTVGREANRVYNETLNGVQEHKKHQFERPVSPYKVAGDPASGLLPGVEAGPREVDGAGDHRVQAYCFRICLTDDPANRLDLLKPAGYDRSEYELLARYFQAGWGDMLFRKFDRLTRHKTDVNNYGAVSSDFIGRNHAWPEADHATRQRLYHEHLTYHLGLLWFLANDPATPASIREPMRQWGRCRDEFVETAGWPEQLYVREGRRMVSDYVTTEHDCLGKTAIEDSVALASYGIDSHNARRFVRDGEVRNEGNVQAPVSGAYAIAYRSIVPAAGQCENLIVPVCLSSSHTAFGSIRMEPVFMILGQSAATAAALAIDSGRAVQRIDERALRRELLAQGQVLDPTAVPDYATLIREGRCTGNRDAADNPQSVPEHVPAESMQPRREMLVQR